MAVYEQVRPARGRTHTAGRLLRRYAGTRTAKGSSVDVFDRARRMIDRLEARIEDFALARDPEIRASLAEADAELAAGNTLSVDELFETLDTPRARR